TGLAEIVRDYFPVKLHTLNLLENLVIAQPPLSVLIINFAKQASQRLSGCVTYANTLEEHAALREMMVTPARKRSTLNQQPPRRKNSTEPRPVVTGEDLELMHNES